jgi:hypothetical protein
VLKVIWIGSPCQNRSPTSASSPLPLVARLTKCDALCSRLKRGVGLHERTDRIRAWAVNDGDHHCLVRDDSRDVPGFVCVGGRPAVDSNHFSARNVLSKLAAILRLIQDSSTCVAVVPVALVSVGTNVGAVRPNDRVEHAHVVRSTRKRPCRLLAAHAER